MAPYNRLSLDSKIKRRIGLLSATGLVIANMIGVGVFTTSGYLIADLGSQSWVLLAWLVGGMIALCGALSYGALARQMPESGGEYYFLSRVIHPLLGFLAGWTSLLAGFTAPIAAAALALDAYSRYAFGVTGPPELIATGAIMIAALMHGVRLGYGVWIQNLAVGLKVVLIVVFVAFGASKLPVAGGSGTTAPEEVFNFGAFAVALVWISFAYSGWNATVYIGSEVRQPQRTLPWSLVLGTCIVTVAYLGLNTVFVNAAPVHQLANRAEIGAIAAQALGGDELRRVASGLVVLALFTSVSAMLMAGPRVYARMAEDGLFPKLFSSTGDVPTAAVILQAGLAILVVWLSQLRELLGYIGFTLGLSTILTVIALVSLRWRKGPENVPIPGYPWITLVFILATLVASGFMLLREPLEALLGLATVASGIPIYYLLRQRRG